MKKRMIILLVCVLALGAIAVPAYAAISDQQKSEIDALYKQIAELQKQLADKYAASGVISQAQADTSKANIDAAEQNREQFSQQNGTIAPVPGYGMPGYGPGFGRGYCAGLNGGFGGRWGGPYNNGQTNWRFNTSVR